MRADSELDNTKETRDAMLDQVVWKDFVRMAQDDSRPEKAHKHISTFKSYRYAGCLLHKPGFVSFYNSQKSYILYYFSLRAKCWLRGGVGGQFPRILN